MSPSALAWRPVFETSRRPSDDGGAQRELDRRAQRSDVPAEAARFYLDAVRERCSIGALALGEDGRVIAASSDGGDAAEELVREAASVVAGGAGSDGAVDLFAHEVRIGERRCVLASTRHRVDRLKSVVADLARILP